MRILVVFFSLLVEGLANNRNSTSSPCAPSSSTTCAVSESVSVKPPAKVLENAWLSAGSGENEGDWECEYSSSRRTLSVNQLE